MVDLASSFGGGTMKRKAEETNTTSSGSSYSTLKPGETNGMSESREVQIEEPKPQAPQDPIRILIMGPSGSGKTYTIEESYRSAKKSNESPFYGATKRVRVIPLDFKGRRFELIDTPGFDNINMSDVEAFSEIADYLRNPQQARAGITGVIYLHRAGHIIHSRSLLRSFRVLANIFLGRTGLTRLSFLVTQCGTQEVEFGRVLQQMQARGSVFSHAFPFGAKIAHSPDRTGFIQTLDSYLSQMPVILPIQLDDSYNSHPAFVTRVEKELGYYEYQSAQSLLDGQEQQLRELYEKKLADQREVEGEIRQELQRSQLEYTSLRSQLQLQENTEQSEVVQTLQDLNRMIEDTGRSISAYLSDEYVPKTFGKDLANVTALDALDLPALKSHVGHVARRTSFIKSSDGQGMQIECFLDYVIRNKICLYVAQEIFSPFHPGINPSVDRVLCSTFQNIQKQGTDFVVTQLQPLIAPTVPQTIAGKWRSETFKNVFDSERHHLTADQNIDIHLNRLIAKEIIPLIKYVFGKDVTLKEDQHNLLRTLIQKAWNWNSRLKGDVVMLGEFSLITYPPYSRFNPLLMEEFEANPRNPSPMKILGTLALGLRSQRAMGGGNPVEETTVCKAVVLTRNVYT